MEIIGKKLIHEFFVLALSGASPAKLGASPARVDASFIHEGRDGNRNARKSEESRSL